MANSFCLRYFHRCVCEQFNEHRNSTAEYTGCHFHNDYFVDENSVQIVKHGQCKFCEDLDSMSETVCYLPHDNGNATDIPINFCPNCGSRLDLEG